jgi:D-alanyl-D-alanine carboxypeptidase
VLSCSDWFDEAARLMDGCYTTYSMTRVLGPTLSAGEMAVTDGEKDRCGMCVMEPLDVPLAVGEAAQVILDVPQSVRAPVYPGMHLGTAKLVADGRVYARSEVVAGERVDADGIHLDVRRIMACWML